MQYEAPDEMFSDHVILLSRAETDLHFDPFDPLDAELPSHLHYARHRFIKEATYEWLIANVGQDNVDWKHFGIGDDCRAFQFKDKGKAAMFKLAFHKGE